ncbi:MAG: hypothetical protein U0441_18270 [Polyangiaceae bacterium]
MQPPYPPPQVAAPLPPKKDNTAGAVIGCLVGFALIIGAAAVGGVYWARGRVGPGVTVPSGGNTTWTSPPFRDPSMPIPVPPAKTYAPEPSIGFAGDLEWVRPVEAADMSHVDIADLCSQARPIAEKLQPGAQFVNIVSFDITSGVADLKGASRVLCEFEFAGTDPTQPPGKDSVEYKIDVEAKAGVLTGRRRKWPASTLKHFGGAIEFPTCSSAKMWATAVSSGVPANAVATIHFYNNKVFSPKSPAVWSVRVDGHDEYRREIDGKTCAMVKNWGKK